MSQTVLICDDTVFMRGVISSAMIEAGFEVAGEAKTGLEAVEQYRQTHPDVVTMDIVMPDMSGIDAVREICEMDPNACIVMCSAMGQDQLVERALAAGALAYVVKPFDPPDLLAEVQRALEEVQLPTTSSPLQL